MKTSWIWLPQDGYEHDSYARFRRVLTLSAKKPVLRIAASSNFAVRLNGQVIQGSQYSDLPGAPTYTDLALSGFWRSGRNTLEIWVYVLGRSSLTTALLPPGLWAEVRDGAKRLDATDESWECAPAPAYASGRCDQLTGQLGDTFLYDARKTRVPSWKKAKPIDAFPAPTARPAAVPPLRERPAPVAHLVQAGQLLRATDAAGTPADLVAKDFLQPMPYRDHFVTPGTTELQFWRYRAPMPFLLAPENAMSFPFTWEAPLTNGANGWYLIVDLGTECTGWLTVTLETTAGTILDIAHGEHLTDGRVRAEIDQRHFADRVICADGVLHFTHRLRRLGARYLELHVTGTEKPPRVGYLGIVPVMRELPKPTEVRTSDRLLAAIDSAAIRTLLCCQHEHYEDCPWREQGLYPYDSRNQALFGYPIWGNYEFTSCCYRLLGGNWCEDAETLLVTSPGNIHLVIPIFGLVWVTALWELYLHSGDPALVKPMLPTVEKLLSAVLAKTLPTPDGDLYHPGKAKEVWNFCEWLPGLDGTDKSASPIQAPYNLYLVETLRAAARLAPLADPGVFSRTSEQLTAEADRLAALCDKLFWDEASGLYRTDDTPATPFHEHTQALAICCGLPKGARLKKLCEGLEKTRTLESTFSTLPYWIRAMHALPEKFHAKILPRLRANYEPSVLSGSPTLWETDLGGEDFYYAGSLCHGWSSIPAWYLRTGLLGIEPTSPGYATFRFHPDFVADLDNVRGSVFTPHGPITAEWHRDADGSLHAKVLACPRECQQEGQP